MNIEIHGFPLESATEIREKLMAKIIGLYVDTDDEGVVTICQTIVQDRHGRQSPYFRVFSDNEKDFELVATWLRPIRMPGAGICTVVECIKLDRCIEL